MHRLLELAQEQVQHVGLPQLLTKVGRQQTAHLHLHPHSVQPGSQVGHQAALGLLPTQLALEEKDLLGPRTVAGGHLLQQPLPAPASRAHQTRHGRADPRCHEITNCRDFNTNITLLHRGNICNTTSINCVLRVYVDLLPPDVPELVYMLVKPQLYRRKE